MANYQPKKISSLFTDIRDLKLVLPNFQRNFVWKINKQKSLLASILVNLNFGVALVVDGYKEKFAVRTIGCNSYVPYDQLRDQITFLLDGQQRITTVYSIFHCVWQNNNYEDVFDGIKNVWFLKLDNLDNDENGIDKDIDSDVFGYCNFNFEDDSLCKLTSDELYDYIDYKKISNKKLDKFYFENIFNKDKKDEIKKYCIEKRLIPLFWIFNRDYNKEVSSIIDNIAENRKEIIIEWFISHNTKNELSKKFREFIDMDEPENKKYAEEIGKNLNSNVFHQTYIPALRKSLLNSSRRWVENIKLFLRRIEEREITFLNLDSSDFERSINIFSALNEGGTPLGLFDLVVARTAMANEKGCIKNTIHDIFVETIEKKITIKLDGGNEECNLNNMNLLDDDSVKQVVAEQLFMINIICCLRSYNFNVSIADSLKDLQKGSYTPKNILKINNPQYEIRKYFEVSVKGFVRTLAFLNQYIGLKEISNVQYTKMITPITICLMQNSVWNNVVSLKKIEGWYWYTVFAGSYKAGRNLDTQSFNDIFNLARLLGLISDEFVQQKIGNNYYSYFQNIRDKKNCEVLNCNEYSDEDSLFGKKINPKLEKTLKQFQDRGCTQINLISNSKNKVDVSFRNQFDTFRDEVISYIKTQCFNIKD